MVHLQVLAPKRTVAAAGIVSRLSTEAADHNGGRAEDWVTPYTFNGKPSVRRGSAASRCSSNATWSSMGKPHLSIFGSSMVSGLLLTFPDTHDYCRDVVGKTRLCLIHYCLWPNILLIIWYTLVVLDFWSTIFFEGTAVQISASKALKGFLFFTLIFVPAVAGAGATVVGNQQLFRVHHGQPQSRTHCWSLLAKCGMLRTRGELQSMMKVWWKYVAFVSFCLQCRCLRMWMNWWPEQASSWCPLLSLGNTYMAFFLAMALPFPEEQTHPLTEHRNMTICSTESS